jgi:hypothetical protein
MGQERRLGKRSTRRLCSLLGDARKRDESKQDNGNAMMANG